MEDTKFMMPGLPVANISGPYYTAEQMHEYAKSAIELNRKEAEAKKEPRPFDLEAAKRGEPIVTRDGQKAVFVGHDPGADKEYRVLARVDSEKCASAYSENGSAKMFGASDRDLFMAPKLNRIELD